MSSAPPAGLRPDPDKLLAIRNFPKPTTPIQFQRFMGMLQYYARHFPRLTTLAAPLHAERSKRSFVWTSEHDKAFYAIREELFKKPMTRVPGLYTSRWLSCLQMPLSRVLVASLPNLLLENLQIPRATSSHAPRAPPAPAINSLKMPESSRRFTSILTVKCLPTQFLFLFPTKSASARVVASLLWTRVFSLFGFPKTIQSACHEIF